MSENIHVQKEQYSKTYRLISSKQILVDIFHHSKRFSCVVRKRASAL